jgi:hypothetical protein
MGNGSARCGADETVKQDARVLYAVELRQVI